MVSDIQIKRDMQTRHDGIGERVLATLRSVRDPAEVWRAVEGGRPALAYFRKRKIETALSLGRFTPGTTSRPDRLQDDRG